MKKTIILSAAVIGLMAINFWIGYNVGKNENISVDSQGDKVTTIDGKRAKVEYFEIGENGGFDVLVTPEDGYELMTEFQLDEGVKYKEAYLVGAEVKQ